MTTKALIEELHRLIDSKKDDEAVLHEVYEILKDDKEMETDWWDEMTDEQRAEQELANEDLKEGKNFISHEEALKRMQSWRKR